MKKIFFLLIFSIGFAYSQSIWTAFDSKWRDSSGVLVPKKFERIPGKYIVGGMSTGNPDSLGGLPASEYAAIGVQASLYRLAYWASTDSLGSTSAVSQAQNGDAITISDSLVVNGRSVLTLIQATGISADSTGLARGTLYIRPSEGIIRWKY